jgi:hypothetical protein
LLLRALILEYMKINNNVANSDTTREPKLYIPTLLL